MASLGKLFVLSGPSGAGKTSICKKIAADLGLYYSISHTTRPKRKGERNGKDYFFLSVDEFTQKKAEGEFLESAEVYGNFYGTSKLIIDQHLAQGQSVILDLDYQGALNLKKIAENAVLIFLAPPSIEVLRQRLLDRGKDSLDVIEKRIEKAEFELSAKNSYDHIVVNENLGRAIDQVKEIIESNLE